MGKKLIVNASACRLQEKSRVRCSYNRHPENKGVDSLLEKIRFALICRTCAAAPCVRACPNNALEKLPAGYRDEGILNRHNMLCTGCGTCAAACPFGTIYTDLIPFPSSHCDLCRNRLEENGMPMCVNTCRDGSIEYREVGDSEHVIPIYEGLAAKINDDAVWKPLLKKNEKA